MANHNINVNLRKRGTSRMKTSANGAVLRISDRMGGASPTSSKNIARTIRSLRTGDLGNMGLFGGGAMAGLAIAQEVVKTSFKALDILLDITLAKTGEAMSVGNLKRMVSYVKNPTSLLVDATYGVWLQQMAIDRHNISNAYYRELSGNLIVGNQYGSKK